jgi:hypothetical protein
MFNYSKTAAGKRRFNNPRIYHLTIGFQNVLHFIGIAIHNPFSDECTSDFNCCNKGLGRTAWMRFGSRTRSPDA